MRFFIFSFLLLVILFENWSLFLTLLQMPLLTTIYLKKKVAFQQPFNLSII